jgi:hypothetical protein
MVDIVVNHFAWAGDGDSVDYSTFDPFNDEKYFHEFKLLSNDTSGDADAPLVVSISPSSKSFDSRRVRTGLAMTS